MHLRAAFDPEKRRAAGAEPDFLILRSHERILKI
jgi:hypothetical protein